MCPASFFTARVFRWTFNIILITANTLWIFVWAKCVVRKAREEMSRQERRVVWIGKLFFGHDFKEKREEIKKNKLARLFISKMVIFNNYLDSRERDTKIYSGKLQWNTGWKASKRIYTKNSYTERGGRKTHFLSVHWFASRLSWSFSSWCSFCRRLWLIFVCTILIIRFFSFNHLRAGDEQDSVLIDSNFDLYLLRFTWWRRLHIVYLPLTLIMKKIKVTSTETIRLA